MKLKYCSMRLRWFEAIGCGVEAFDCGCMRLQWSKLFGCGPAFSTPLVYIMLIQVVVTRNHILLHTLLYGKCATIGPLLIAKI